MQVSVLLLLIFSLALLAYYFARKRSFYVAGGSKSICRLHSLPIYYGIYTALWLLLPALLVISFWLIGQDKFITNMMIASLPEEIRKLPTIQLSLIVNDIKNLATGNIISGNLNPIMRQSADHYNSLYTTSYAALTVITLVIAIICGIYAWRMISPKLRARNHVEGIVQTLLIMCSSIAILTTIGIVLSVFFEAMRFFQMVPIWKFIFGLEWSPQIALRSDQVGSSGSFGAIPLFTGTMLIAIIAMVIAVPIGLMSAIYLSEYSNSKFRATAKPILEILAGIPTVVYGFFAALIVAPFLRDIGIFIGLDVSSESALSAGLVMGIMIIPFISSLSDDVINAVPRAMRDGSLAIGATHSETVIKVIIPAALPGIIGGILLAISRAIGETMIVVMATGLSANLTANPLESVTTVTVQIVTLLVGDQEFDSPKTLVAFALGLMLFIITLILNIIALYIVRKYREQYE